MSEPSALAQGCFNSHATHSLKRCLDCHSNYTYCGLCDKFIKSLNFFPYVLRCLDIFKDENKLDNMKSNWYKPYLKHHTLPPISQDPLATSSSYVSSFTSMSLFTMNEAMHMIVIGALQQHIEGLSKMLTGS